MDRILLIRTRALQDASRSTSPRHRHRRRGREGRRAPPRPRGHRSDLPRRQQPRPVGGRPDHHRRDELVRPGLRAGGQRDRGGGAGRRPRSRHAGSPRPATRSCSGRCAEAAATSAIITALELRLLPGFHLYGGRLMWPLEQMPAVLRAFREVTARAPEKLTAWFHAYQFPPLPELPEAIRGRVLHLRGGRAPGLGRGGRGADRPAPGGRGSGHGPDGSGPDGRPRESPRSRSTRCPRWSLAAARRPRRRADRPTDCGHRRGERVAPGRAPDPAPRRCLRPPRPSARGVRARGPALPAVRASACPSSPSWLPRSRAPSRPCTRRPPRATRTGRTVPNFLGSSGDPARAWSPPPVPGSPGSSVRWTRTARSAATAPCRADRATPLDWTAASAQLPGADRGVRPS